MATDKKTKEKLKALKKIRSTLIEAKGIDIEWDFYITQMLDLIEKYQITLSSRH